MYIIYYLCFNVSVAECSWYIRIVYHSAILCFQAQNASEDVAQKVILPLAQRMIKKFMDEGKIEADPEIQLYMMILEMQV